MTIASMLLTPISPLLASPASAYPAIDDTTIPAGEALYRTTITLPQPGDHNRLTDLGVTILDTGADDTALVLADETQLEQLARQRFEPRNTDKLDTLLGGTNLPASRPELQTLLTNLPSIDNDGDGLTDTEEQWWCTDPNNPNSDADANGYTDGQEVAALLDFTLPRTTRWNYGPPFGPPAAWPDFNGQDGNPATPACNDGDYDTIPDMAEAYVVGTRVGTQDSENTDGDKFDDGQEFFGLTYCPGGAASCGYGNYPRTQDYSFITSAMPSWIRPPGDSPFVAAYPVIEFDIDPSSIRVVAKEVKTIERTITQGEEISTGFAETKGNSTSVGTIDTNTHSTWQEHSSTEGGIEPASVSLPQLQVESEAGSIVISDYVMQPAILQTQSNTPKNIPQNYLCTVGDTVNKTANLSAGETQVCDSLVGIINTGQENSLTIPTKDVVMMVTEINLLSSSNGDVEWAIIQWIPVWKDTLTPIGPRAYPVIGRNLNGGWQWATAGTERFLEWAESLPDLAETVPLKELARYLFDLAQKELGIFGDREAGYQLPWRSEEGKIYLVQGENGSYSHQNQNAYDFEKRVNQDGNEVYVSFPIVAAKSGHVIVRKDSSDDEKDNCSTETEECYNKANWIWILHEDGTVARYLHLQKGSIPDNIKACVRNDLKDSCYVAKGDVIGNAGNTGFSSNIHLHLDVRRNGATIPLEFDGIEGGLIEAQYYENGSSNVERIEACYEQPIKSRAAAVLRTLANKAKDTFFSTKIGQKVESVWNYFGDFIGGQSVELVIQSNGTVTSSSAVNYSDIKSSGQCGGSYNSDSQTPYGGGGGGGGGSGLTLQDDGAGGFTKLRVWSETTTSGEGESTSHSELRTETEYSEVTRSQVNTLVSSEAWATASTVDPTDAGQLTFNYNLRNAGSDAAVNIINMDVNILIGDLPVLTWRAPDTTNILPAQSKGPFSSDPLVLTLEQLAAIDNGAPIRVVLADYSYDDQLYDLNAWGRSVLFHVDDGIADGDRDFDTYLIATNLEQNETYQQTLARYFDVDVFEAGPDDPRSGTLTNIRTPEFNSSGEITGWNDHPVGDNAWWELAISSGGETAGVTDFKAMPAKSKQDIYLRYFVDSDGDGYTDQTEQDALSDPNDPVIHPRPLLVAAQHTEINGSTATVQLALQNDGNFDAGSVEVWAIAPDDSITISDNLIGGGGRVGAASRVVLGARVGAPDLTNWPTGSSKPYFGGQFVGTSTQNYQFRADSSGTVGSSAGLTISWSRNGGAWTPLTVGIGYTPLDLLPLADGLSVAFTAGSVTGGEQFSAVADIPIDTFAYTINRTPYTPPLLVVSYNDPQGNHKFVSDVDVSPIQADLAPYYGRMRYDLQLEALHTSSFNAGANTTRFVFHNPTDTTISGASLTVQFALPDGTVAYEQTLANQTFEPGPNHLTLNWDTGSFVPAFDPTSDTYMLAVAQDRQGTVIEHTVREIKALGKDQLPKADLLTSTWDFGTVAQGELLNHTLTLANTGFRDLVLYVDGPPEISLGAFSNHLWVSRADATPYRLTLNTTGLPAGAYNATLTIRTSDLDVPSQTVQVTGTIDGSTSTTRTTEERPLDLLVTIPGNHTQGEWQVFTHTLGADPQSLHPVKVYGQDYGTLLGVGKYATNFGSSAGTADMFGDGRDGIMPTSGNLNNDNGFGVGSVSGTAGSSSVSVVDRGAVWRIKSGDAVLIHQTQGTGAGNWEINRAASDFATSNLALKDPLKHSYGTGAQILRVPQYSSCTVDGTVTPLLSWNGTEGGIFAVMCNNTMTVNGSINASNFGFRGGQGGIAGPTGKQGETYSGIGGTSTNRNNGGGGGGQGSYDADGADGGGGGGYGGGGGNGFNGMGGGSHIPGQGGYSNGSPDLSSNILFGSGGGGGGGYMENSLHFDGGNGGGIIVLYVRGLTLNGSISSKGEDGDDNHSGVNKQRGGAAGGGAGGSIFLTLGRSRNGSGSITVNGGARGDTDPDGEGGDGGDGGGGRVRIDSCDTNLDCYIVEQNETVPYNTGQLSLPQVITDGQTYVVQYGRKLDFAAAGEQVTSLRVANKDYLMGHLEALVSNVVSSSLTLRLDIGNNGSWDWDSSQPITGATSLSSPDLAAAFSAATPGSGGEFDVPVRVYLDQPGQVILTNLALEPLAPDISITGADIVPGASNPSEGSTVPLNLTVHNNGGLGSEPLIAAMYATPLGQTERYIGSAFIPSVPGGGSSQVTIPWDTSGFIGPTTLRALLDPFNRLLEPDEGNNEATGSLTILTRPDLHVPLIFPDDAEPVAGQAVSVQTNLRNDGQTAAGNSTVALYAGSETSSDTLVGENQVAVGAQSLAQQSFTWTPTQPGPHRLRTTSDRDDTVDEYDEGNNQSWQEVYVGFGSSLALDSGAGSEPVYTATLGYGVVDVGQPDLTPTCGDGVLPEETLRQDPGGQLVYRFDHLLPGHYYHLDVTMAECDSAGRQQSIYLDSNPVAVVGPEDLGDGKVHRRSIRLDPAIYADHVITASIEAPGFDGVVVNAVNLHDVDYRYADAGSSQDVAYPGSQAYGWLDGTVNSDNGNLPYQTVRVNLTDNELHYRFDDLDPLKNYNIHLTFWQPSGSTGRIQQVQIDGQDVGETVDTSDYTVHYVTVAVPLNSYINDGSIIVGIVRAIATTGAMVSEIALEEETVAATNTCVVNETPYFSEVYGVVNINEQPAPVGTVVQAISPRGDTVGCYTVDTAGQYGTMRIYGEDASANPPGMRAGELVIFRVNGAMGVATPVFSWQDDHANHAVNLDAGVTEGQSILLKQPWRLLSFRMEPPVPSVQQTLISIDNRYARVIGEDGVYVPTLPEKYNTLTELHAGLSYYVRITTTKNINALIEGVPVAADTPLPLHPGWNWVGYLPTTTLPITVALQSIDGDYDRVQSLSDSYDPSLPPSFNPLKQMEPGQGYLIHATTPTTLTYPAAAGVNALTLEATAPDPQAACQERVWPTPWLTVVYGPVTVDGEPAPAGTRVEAVTPRGEIAGCFVVETPGQFGLMHLYGEDDSAAPVIGGFRAGEAVTFRVNGLPVENDVAVVWQDDRAIQFVADGLAGSGQKIYLPTIFKEAQSGSPVSR